MILDGCRDGLRFEMPVSVFLFCALVAFLAFFWCYLLIGGSSLSLRSVLLYPWGFAFLFLFLIFDLIRFLWILTSLLFQYSFCLVARRLVARWFSSYVIRWIARLVAC